MNEQVTAPTTVLTGGEVQRHEHPPVAYATLRAHPYAVTSTHFLDNRKLVSGDEGGWCFVWSLVTRRPVVVWRPHRKAIVAAKFLPANHQTEHGLLVMTHGRDHKLRVYLVLQDTAEYNISLPTANDPGDNWKAPQVVYEQDVNALNFCAVAISQSQTPQLSGQSLELAVPSTIASENIDVYRVDRTQDNQLSRLAAAVKPPTPPNQPLFPESETSRNQGIVMAMLVVEVPLGTLLVAGYESGLVAVFKIVENEPPQLLYAAKCHTQPILSLDLDRANFSWFMSSSADAKLVQHPLVTESKDPWGVQPLATFNTKHPGIASIAIRNDSKIFATAGWDGMIRIFLTKPKGDNFKCLATFKGGRQNGVSTVAFSPLANGSIHDTVKDTLAAKLERRKAVNANLIAVGGKDGRIALYSLY